MVGPSPPDFRAAMPFVDLGRELWDLRDAAGKEVGPDVPERCV